MVDVSSRYVDAVPADVICGNLKIFPVSFVVLYKLHTGGASDFVGDIFKEFCASLGVNHTVGSPCYPQTQGMVERSHQTLKGV